MKILAVGNELSMNRQFKVHDVTRIDEDGDAYCHGQYVQVTRKSPAYGGIKLDGRSMKG